MPAATKSRGTKPKKTTNVSRRARSHAESDSLEAGAKLDEVEISHGLKDSKLQDLVKDPEIGQENDRFEAHERIKKECLREDAAPGIIKEDEDEDEDGKRDQRNEDVDEKHVYEDEKHVYVCGAGEIGTTDDGHDGAGRKDEVDERLEGDAKYRGKVVRKDLFGANIDKFDLEQLQIACKLRGILPDPDLYAEQQVRLMKVQLKEWKVQYKQKKASQEKQKDAKNNPTQEPPDGKIVYFAKGLPEEFCWRTLQVI
jgi:hypothetical protein